MPHYEVPSRTYCSHKIEDFLPVGPGMYWVPSLRDWGLNTGDSGKLSYG